MSFKTSYKEKGVIGRGNFGVASLVVEKSSGEEFIAKKINLASLSEYELKSCQLEANILKSLDHDNIVKYKEAFVEPGQLVIVMEYCRGGDLAQLISSHKQARSYFPEAQVKEWMTQLLSALSYLDSRRIIHRDIKSSNIYLTEKGTLKLGDFGIAKVLSCTSDVAKTLVGTPYYMSPEVCDNKPYTSKSDVWSLGVLFYELMALKHPFIGTSFLALVLSILNGTPEPLNPSYSGNVISIVNSMLTKDMRLRPSAQALLKLPYLRDYDYCSDSQDEVEYEVSFSDSSQNEDSVNLKTNALLVSGINPLELLNTEIYDSASFPNNSIPTFTPDVHVSQSTLFAASLRAPNLAEDCEYEDDFESVTPTQESSSDQPYDEDFDEEDEEKKRTEAVRVLGPENFSRIYEYLKLHRKYKTPDDVVRVYLDFLRVS